MAWGDSVWLVTSRLEILQYKTDTTGNHSASGYISMLLPHFGIRVYRPKIKMGSGGGGNATQRAMYLTNSSTP